ncbi:MAG: D-aminoacyl-tRNA deacylase [Tissierellia bacterium]|nr:D-aminoacyl-tRNA deacylase [Tissierellia bacterium]
MRAVVQRVKTANVVVDGNKVGEIGEGIVLLLGIAKEDTEKDLDYIYRKVVNLRIFDDKDGVMNESLLDHRKELLVVSQFTLYGDGRKGNRPSYIRAANGAEAEKLYQKFIQRGNNDGLSVATGVFGADMDLTLINDGPVTILLDSEKVF